MTDCHIIYDAYTDTWYEVGGTSDVDDTMRDCMRYEPEGDSDRFTVFAVCKKYEVEIDRVFKWLD